MFLMLNIRINRWIQPIITTDLVCVQFTIYMEK